MKEANDLISAKNFSDAYDHFKPLIKRKTREELAKLADNIPNWEFKGSTDDICKLAQNLINKVYGTIIKESRISIFGGQGKNNNIFQKYLFFYVLIKSKKEKENHSLLVQYANG